LPKDSETALLLKAAEESTLKGQDITNRLLTLPKAVLPNPQLPISPN